MAAAHSGKLKRQKRNCRARKAGRAQDTSRDSGHQKRALVLRWSRGDGAKIDGIFCDLEETKQELERWLRG